MISPESVSSIVKRIGKLKEAPMNLELNDMGFNNEGLRKIQIAFTTAFNFTVADVYFTDTIYTLTDRLNKKSV